MIDAGRALWNLEVAEQRRCRIRGRDRMFANYPASLFGRPDELTMAESTASKTHSTSSGSRRTSGLFTMTGAMNKHKWLKLLKDELTTVNSS